SFLVSPVERRKRLTDIDGLYSASLGCQIASKVCNRSNAKRERERKKEKERCVAFSDITDMIHSPKNSSPKMGENWEANQSKHVDLASLRETSNWKSKHQLPTPVTV